MTNKEEIYKYFIDQYPNLGKIQKILLLSHNNINSTNYLIISSKGRYVLRKFTDGSRPEKIETICNILHNCIKENIPVLNPIKNIKNKYVDAENNVYLTWYHVGRLFNGSSEQITNLAKEMALLHRKLANITIKYNYKTNHNYYKILTIHELDQIKDNIILKRNMDSFDKSVLENLEFVKEQSFSYKKELQDIKKAKLKKQLIHYDLHPRNVIFSKNRVTAIIDFNSMRKGSKIEDIAFTSFRFASYKNINISKIKKLVRLFVDSYTNYNTISENEIDLMDYFLAHNILGKISYILKKRYYNNSDSWIQDFQKNIDSLRLLRGKKLLDTIRT